MELKTKSQMIMRIAELSEENEKLKEEIKLAQELSDQSIEYFGNSREEFKKKSHRYKQALEQIKDIALKSMENNRYNGNSEYKMILGIINEVL